VTDLRPALALRLLAGRFPVPVDFTYLSSRPAGIAQKRWFYIGLVVTCVAVCAVLAGLQSPIAFPLDDAYITIHNAQVLLSGVDRNYPGTPALFGATSPIHLAVVVALLTLFDPVAAAYAAGAIAMTAYALGLARLAFDNHGTVWSAAALVILGTLTGYAPYHLLNGLETGLAMAAVTWALVFASASTRGLAVPLVCGALPFIRPELVALSVLLMARQTFLRMQSGEGWRPIIGDVAVAALVAAPCLIWQWLALGTLVPPTASAKAAFFSEANADPWSKAREIILGLSQAGILPVAVLFIATIRTSLSIVVSLFVLVVCCAFYLTFPGGIGQNWSRYAFVLLPALLYGIAERGAGERWFRVVKFALCGVTIASAYHGVSAYAVGSQWTRTELADVAQWINDNVPPDAPVLIHDAGFLSFATTARLVDLVGLKTPDSFAVHKRLTARNADLRGQALREIARRSGARYAVILNDRDHWWAKLADELQGEGQPLRRLRLPASAPGYIVYQLSPPAE
jgi:hypothetical protein